MLDTISCDSGLFDSISNTLTLNNGEDVVCTFTNRDIVSDLSIVKSVDDSTPNIQDTINFTLVVNNAGPDPASNVVVDDILPAGLTLVAGSMTGGDSQNQSAPNLQWTINYIGVGAANSITLQYQSSVNPLP